MSDTEPPELLIELDSRRRAALGRLASHDRYLAHQEPDGTLVLTLAEVMSKRDAELLRANPGSWKQ